MLLETIYEVLAPIAHPFYYLGRALELQAGYDMLCWQFGGQALIGRGEYLAGLKVRGKSARQWKGK